MKFFHLSDLHIGLKLMNRDLREDQEYILRQIVEIARREKPDAVVIAGDIYDKAVPSAEAVEVFDGFIGELTAALPDAVVMMISGNHDSASRVNCFRKVLSRQNLYMIGQPPRTPEEHIEKVTCTDAYGKVNFYLLPFVKPSMVKNVIGTDENGNNFSYEESVRALIEREAINPGERNVLVSHQFYLPKGMAAEDVERMDSEVRTVGNIDEVSSEVLNVFDYAALGHIHKPMKVGDERFRYCGTPLACSVSEAGQQKEIIMVELGHKCAAGKEAWERSAEYEEKWKKTAFGRYEAPNGSCGTEYVRSEEADESGGTIPSRGEAPDGRGAESCGRREKPDGYGGTACASDAASGGQCTVSDSQGRESLEQRCEVEKMGAECGEAWERPGTRKEGGGTVKREKSETCLREKGIEDAVGVRYADVSVPGNVQSERADIRITTFPLTPLRQIRVIKGTLEEVLGQPSMDYVTVILTDKTDLEVIDMQERLRQAFPYLLEIRRETERRADYGAVVEAEKDMDPFELCCAFLKEVDEEEQAILRDVIRTVQEVEEE